MCHPDRSVAEWRDLLFLFLTHQRVSGTTLVVPELFQSRTLTAAKEQVLPAELAVPEQRAAKAHHPVSPGTR
jgi:hypothetical protein